MSSDPALKSADLFGPTDYAPRDLTTLELADLFGVSDRTIRDLVARGVIEKTARDTFPLRATVNRYTAHLREMAAARGGQATAGLTEARERVTREKADQIALRNAELRRDLLPAAEVEDTWMGIVRRIRSQVLAVPNRCHQRLPHLTPADTAAIDREIRDALTEIAADDPDA